MCELLQTRALDWLNSVLFKTTYDQVHPNEMIINYLNRQPKRSEQNDEISVYILLDGNQTGFINSGDVIYFDEFKLCSSKDNSPVVDLILNANTEQIETNGESFQEHKPILVCCNVENKDILVDLGNVYSSFYEKFGFAATKCLILKPGSYTVDRTYCSQDQFLNDNDVEPTFQKRTHHKRKNKNRKSLPNPLPQQKNDIQNTRRTVANDD